MSEDQKKTVQPQEYDIGLNFVLAGKWNVIPERISKDNWEIFRKDYSQIPFAQRTDIDAATELLKNARVNDALSWEEYGAIDRIDIYEEEREKNRTNEGKSEPENQSEAEADEEKSKQNEPKSAYWALREEKDAPLYGESQFFCRPIRKIIYNSSEPGSKELSSIFYLNGLKQRDNAKSEGYLAEYVVQYYDSYQHILTEYRMDINSIMLRLFSVGVMALSIHTEGVSVRRFIKAKGKCGVKEDALPIEQVFCNCGSIGRRMYQPFINEDNSGCVETAAYSCVRFYKEQEEIQIPICYNMEQYPSICKQWEEKIGFIKPSGLTKREMKHQKFAHPNSLCFLEELFGDRCISFERWSDLDRKKQKEKRIIVTPFHDDRMYVHGYFVDDKSDGLPNRLKTLYPIREKLLSGAEDWNDPDQNVLKKWYAVLQLDKDCSASCHDMEMLRQHIERDTYTRWLGYGTLYGLTGTNFIMVLNERSPSTEYLFSNMQWHYFQLFLIALLQRCSTLRFYEEAAAIMNQSMQDKDVPKLCDSLRSQYIIFLNSVWWKEVSLQIQGQEMYRMLSANMEIDDNVKQLDEALSELYDYNEGVYQKKISNAMNLFSAAGLLWAIIELMGFLYGGMSKEENPNIIADILKGCSGEIQEFCSAHPIGVTIGLCAATIGIAWALTTWVSRSGKPLGGIMRNILEIMFSKPSDKPGKR